MAPIRERRSLHVLFGQVLEDSYEGNCDTVGRRVNAAILQGVAALPAEEAAEESASDYHEEGVDTHEPLAVLLAELQSWNQLHQEQGKEVNCEDQVGQLVVDVLQVLVVTTVNVLIIVVPTDVHKVQLETRLDLTHVSCAYENEREHC